MTTNFFVLFRKRELDRGSKLCYASPDRENKTHRAEAQRISWPCAWFGVKNVKRVFCYILVGILALSLSACGKRTQAPDPTDSPLPSPSASPSMMPDTEPTAAPSPSGSTAPEPAPDYERIYHAFLTERMETDGVCLPDEQTGLMGGVLYADVQDFDGDGIPELVCVVGNMAHLYTIEQKNGEAHMAPLLEVEAGGEYGHTDVCLKFRFPLVDGKPYIVVNHTGNEWSQDSWTAYTLVDGEVKAKEFFAETDGNNEYPSDEFLVDCRIDGASVSPADYVAEKEKFYKEGTPEIDVAFMDAQAAMADLEALLERLA